MNSHLSDILLDRKSSIPLYVQLSNAIGRRIENGQIPPRTKLPGSRKLSQELGLHRQTVVEAYSELHQQGFIVMEPKRGSFVNSSIPKLGPQEFGSSAGTSFNIGSMINPHHYLEIPVIQQVPGLQIDEGLPDLRLSPIQEIRRDYAAILSKPSNMKLLGYQSPRGNQHLIEELTKYFEETRGLKLGNDGLMITRGSQMGLYLAASLLLVKGDRVVVGELNYQTANITFIHHGASLIHVPVDEFGIEVDALEAICKKDQIKMIYVTSHHHHPTTATLSVERRVRLLQLAEQYNFVILEDDYDYDFHYERSPLMPLKSADYSGRVIYVGGISKNIAPGLRIGFLVAPSLLISKAEYLRRVMDRQGDHVMEQVIANMFRSGDYHRFAKKVLKTYGSRRDAFIEKLIRIPEFSFDKPLGGLAIWAGLDQKISLEALSKKLKSLGLLIPRWQNYDPQLTGHNHIRLGFASLNEEELELVFNKVHEAMDYLRLQTS